MCPRGTDAGPGACGPRRWHGVAGGAEGGTRPMTMTQDERDAWARADKVLDALLDLPPDARRAHLARLDVDGPLRRRVARLLAAMEEGDGPLDHPSPMLPSLDEHEIGRAACRE